MKIENLYEIEIRHLRDAMLDACDLLAERKHGSFARSPGHNARLVLEEALRGYARAALTKEK